MCVESITVNSAVFVCTEMGVSQSIFKVIQPEVIFFTLVPINSMSQRTLMLSVASYLIFVYNLPNLGHILFSH